MGSRGDGRAVRARYGRWGHRLNDDGDGVGGVDRCPHGIKGAIGLRAPGQFPLLNRAGWVVMDDAFHWHLQLPRWTTYAERAEECRRLARVCPDHMRDSYLELAGSYEQLALQTD